MKNENKFVVGNNYPMMFHSNGDMRHCDVKCLWVSKSGTAAKFGVPYTQYESCKVYYGRATPVSRHTCYEVFADCEKGNAAIAEYKASVAARVDSRNHKIAALSTSELENALAVMKLLTKDDLLREIAKRNEAV